MREIKFRAWAIDQKKMLSWQELMKDRNLVYSFFGNEAWMTNPPKPMWGRMQFTGLHDVFGREIYEGDILAVSPKREITGSPLKGRVPNNDNVTVSFSEGAFKISSKPKKTRYSLTGLMIRTKGYRVIGNIYEHKHLLDEKP